MKRIATGAYQALRDALPAVVWNKRPFESMLRTSLREHPELLAGLTFSDTKREVADVLVDRLVAGEDKCRDATLDLMLEVASMRSFPNLAQMKDEHERMGALAEAEHHGGPEHRDEGVRRVGA